MAYYSGQAVLIAAGSGPSRLDGGPRVPAPRLAVQQSGLGADPAPDEPAPAQRRNQADTPPTWDAVSAKLASDPTIRTK